MTHRPNLLRYAPAALLLAALPLAAQAQTPAGTSQPPTQAELLRRGDLVGGRPHASQPRVMRTTTTVTTTTTGAARATSSGADPTLARLMNEQLTISQLPAAALPGVYDRLLDAVHENYRQWSARDWADASAVLARLNARYEAVRQEVPLNQRVNVRTAQGEFRTLEAAAARRR